MTDMRAKIDELIEESYLATLPAEKIRQDLLQFLHICARSTEESGLDDRAKEHILRGIRRSKEIALSLDAPNDLFADEEEQEQWKSMSEQEQLAHRAARVKMLTMDSIRAVNAAFAADLELKRFPNLAKVREATGLTPLIRRVKPKAKAPVLSTPLDMTVLRIAYALVAGATLFLVGYRLFN